MLAKGQESSSGAALGPAEERDRDGKADATGAAGREVEAVAWDEDASAPERGLNAFTVLVLFTAVLGGSTFGLDIGSTAVTSMNTFREEMGIPELQPGKPDSPEVAAQISLFAVLFHVASLVGAPFSGYIADRVGRKPVIIIASTLFLLGAAWQSMAGLVHPSFAWASVLLGRCLGGIGNGFILTVMPLYSAELAPASFRGKVITLFQLFITIGIFIMAIANNELKEPQWGWRLGIALQCIPCLLIIVLTVVALPESPRFLMKNGNPKAARKALNRLAKGTQDANAVVDFEMAEMQAEIEEMNKVGTGGFLELFQGAAFPALLCGAMVAFSQNVTGVNWFMNFATTLFNSLGFQPFVFDLILKALNMVATLVALAFVDRMGRKYLTVWGTILVIAVFLLIALVIVGTGVDITQTTGQDNETKAVQLFCVLMIFLFQIIFAITWGPIGWIVPGEVFPLRLRGVGMSVSVVANMASNIALGDYGYQNMSASSLGLSGTMFIAVVFNVLIVLTTVVALQPETKGVTLEEMRYVFSYEVGGNASLQHGTLSAFIRRNLAQCAQILRCRAANTKMGFERFATAPEAAAC